MASAPAEARRRGAAAGLLLAALGCAGAVRPAEAPPPRPAAAVPAASVAPAAGSADPATGTTAAAAAPAGPRDFDVLGSHGAARAAAEATVPGARATALLGTRDGAGGLAWRWTFEGEGGAAAEVKAGPDGVEVAWRGRLDHARAPGFLDLARLTLRPSDLPRLAGGRPIASALLSASGPPPGRPRWHLALVGGGSLDAEADAPAE